MFRNGGTEETMTWIDDSTGLKYHDKLILNRESPLMQFFSFFGMDDTWRVNYAAFLSGITTLTYVEAIDAGEKWHLDISFLIPHDLRVSQIASVEMQTGGTLCEDCAPFLTFNLKKFRFEVEGGGLTRKKEAWKKYKYNLLLG